MRCDRINKRVGVDPNDECPLLSIISPMIWRRLLVASHTTIAQLHDILQTAMGWENLHLHQFRIYGKAYGISRAGGMWFDDDPYQVILADFTLRPHEHFVYEYDMGDFWQQDIRIEQVLPFDLSKTYPVCTGGAGNCPPEDCGGLSGYRNMLAQRCSWEAEALVEARLAREALLATQQQLQQLQSSQEQTTDRLTTHEARIDSIEGLMDDLQMQIATYTT